MISPMKWNDTANALVQPLKACFDLTLAERRFMLGALLLICLGLAARWLHERNAPLEPYSPPQEQATP